MGDEDDESYNGGTCGSEEDGAGGDVFNEFELRVEVGGD